MKKGALEMSIGTIVIIVIAITMLILGIVFVRSVMCGALGLTGDLNDKVRSEIEELFGTTGGEVQCLGSSGEAVKIIPGKVNNIWCGINAKGGEADYSITLTSYQGTDSTKSEIKSWIITESWQGKVGPEDKEPKKVIRLDIPEGAAEERIILQVTVKKDNQLISTQDLDFDISRAGFFRATMC